MKKTALVLAFLLALGSFASCANGGKSESVIVIDDNDFMDSEKGDNGDDDIESGDILPDGEDDGKKSTDKKDDAEKPGEDEEETSAGNELSDIQGSISGSFYTNEYFGLKMSAPFGWKLISGEAVNAFSSLSDNIMGFGDIVGESKTEDKDSASLVKLDVMSINRYNDTGVITVSLMNLSLQPQKDELTADHIADMMSSLNGGSSSKENVKLAGKEYIKVTCIAGSEVSAYYIRKEGEFVCVVSVTETSVDAVNALEKNFTALN